MSRSAVPSQAQLEILMDSIEEKRWLATGHARTSHARDRTRTAWQDIAVKLNSDGRGCIKTWQQWSKYWKDKKSATKKKASQMRMARQLTGGGAAEAVSLSAIEERILAVMGGEGFAVGDSDLQINPFHQSTNETEPMAQDQDETKMQDAVELNLQDVEVEVHARADSESILLAHVEPMTVEPGTTGLIFVPETEQSTPSLPDLQPGPSQHRHGYRVENEPHSHEDQGLNEFIPNPTAAAPPTINTRSVNRSATSTPRRRRLVTRRRVIRRPPPAQRQSQMASLTERFIAIEERRVATEHMLAQNQHTMIHVLREMSEAWSRQSQALQDLVAHIF